MRGQARRVVEREADADVALAPRMAQPLGAHPFEGAVRAFVDVHDDLVLERGMAPDALDAQLQIRQVVPGRDQDTEHRAQRSVGEDVPASDAGPVCEAMPARLAMTAA